MKVFFYLVVHHSRRFSNGDRVRYVGGDTSTWSRDSSRWSYFEIVGIVKEMDFLTVQKMWY